MGVSTFMVHEGPEYEHTLADWTTTVNDVIRDDTGEVVKVASYHITACGVPGAMFWWDLTEAAADERKPRSSIFASGPQLCVILPNGEFWNIDARASNCTMPEDFEHRCWIRHGEPPVVTVDKNGPTCAAGAGSIMSGSYHGFLQNGEFT